MVQRMSAVAKEGDVVLLVSPDGKRYLIRLKPSEEWHCHKGCIRHDDLIDKPLGRTLHTQYGLAILALEPSTHDLIHGLPRASQIIYSKDAAQIVMRLSLYPGRTVVEAGTGSAGLTMMLARSVMPTGHVYSYETRPESFTMARNNLDDLGLLPYVTLYNEDITGGFHETEVDAIFLDLREPWLFLNQAWAAVERQRLLRLAAAHGQPSRAVGRRVAGFTFRRYPDGGDHGAALEDRGRPAPPRRSHDCAQRVSDLRPEDRGRRRIAVVDAG